MQGKPAAEKQNDFLNAVKMGPWPTQVEAQAVVDRYNALVAPVATLINNSTGWWAKASS